VPEPRVVTALATGGVGADERVSDRFDAALAEMRDFLRILKPTTDAEALQSLRLAFPTTPLCDRIEAIRTQFFA
jgi:hypothetical protein